MPASPLLDREFLERLERLTLQWQKSFRGLVGGHNLSRFAGSGQEFLDHRTFHHGDDLRSVNWRAFLRLDKLFLKMFQVEPRVPVRVLLDTSVSMTAGSSPGTPTKFDYVRRLVAAMTYVGLVKLDTLALQPFGSRLLDPIVCSGGRHRFQPAEQYLRKLVPAGNTNLFEIAREYIETYPQRGLTIVVSDFLDPIDAMRPLQYLSDFGHELMLIHVWGDEDRVPSGSGEFAMFDAESGVESKVSLDESSRRAYTTAFDEFAIDLQRLALRNGGRYAGLQTDVAIEDALFGQVPLSRGVA